MLRRICNGATCKADGTEYDEDQIEACFDLLADLNHNPYFDKSLADRDFDRLYKLFFDSVASLSGRVRGLVSYTQARNTSFQSAAADGCKRALWRLYREGFESIGFIHDECLTLVDEDHADEQVTAIESICIEETHLVSLGPR